MKTFKKPGISTFINFIVIPQRNCSNPSIILEPSLPLITVPISRLWQNRRDTSRYDISATTTTPSPRYTNDSRPTIREIRIVAGSACINSSRLKSEKEEEEEEEGGGVCPRGIRGGAPPFLGFLSFYEAKLIYAAGFTTPSTSACLPNGLRRLMLSAMSMSREIIVHRRAIVRIEQHIRLAGCF